MPPLRSSIRHRHLSLIVLSLVFGMALPGCTRGGGPLEDGLYMRTHLSSAMFLWIEMVYVSGDRIAWHANGGVDPFDFDAAEKADPKNVGHYKIKGDQIEITWGGGAGTANWHLEFKQGKVSAINAGGIVKAEPYSKGATMDVSFSGKIGPLVTAAQVPSDATLTFTKGGQFTFHASGMVPYGNTTSRVGPEVNRSGTYELAGNTLTLHFSDGATERHTVLPFDKKLVYDAVQLEQVH